jgi:hypothetical protein
MLIGLELDGWLNTAAAAGVAAARAASAAPATPAMRPAIGPLASLGNSFDMIIPPLSGYEDRFGAFPGVFGACFPRAGSDDARAL